MKLAKCNFIVIATWIFLALSPIAFTNCAGSASPTVPTGSSSPTLTSASIPTSGTNVMQVRVGTCGASGYVNEVCASVTVCVPGTSTCQTVDDVLVDTGSYGLRIFQSVLTINLPQVTADDGGALSTCAVFGDGASDWGQVQLADVKLASEVAPSVPIQVINSNNIPAGCINTDTGPSQAGFNGILGVGLFTQDCGTACTNNPANNIYFSCTGTNCPGSNAEIGLQVTNPVSLLPTDNNGVELLLPGVPSSGAPSITGALVLGIGTQSNNGTAGATLYPTNSAGDFYTSFEQQTLTAFLDSGSNALYFPPNTVLPTCSASPDYYCPSVPVPFSAIQGGASLANVTVGFEVIDESTIQDTGAYNDLAGINATDFDWGLPFFLGRAIFVGIENTTSSLGTGPYWAY